ncbi:MAG: hypothetical protein EOM66_03110 [Clostridia bacterium]|nr:hypothetical protein [Clostridia bacterium]
MSEYVCTKSFIVDRYDDDGFFTENQDCIEKGQRFHMTDSSWRLIGGADTVRLEADGGDWLEITKDTLAEYFAQAGEVKQDGC